MFTDISFASLYIIFHGLIKQIEKEVYTATDRKSKKILMQSNDRRYVFAHPEPERADGAVLQTLDFNK